MMKFVRTLQSALPIVVAAATMLLLAIFINELVNDGRARELSNLGVNMSEWGEGWALEQDGGETAVELPYSRVLNGGTLTLKKTLPDELPPNPMLYFNTDYQRISVTIGGEPVFVKQMASSYGLSCACPWSSVELNEELCGREICVTVGSSGSKAATEIYRVLLGSYEAIALYTLSSSAEAMVICCFMLMLAFALLLMSQIAGKKNRRDNNAGFAWLALFVVMSAAWVFTDSDAQAEWFIDSATYFLVNLYCYMLMPIPLLIFARKQCNVLKLPLDLLVLAFTLLFIGNFVTMLTGSFKLYISLSASHVLMVAFVTVLPATALIERRKYGNQDIMDIFWGIVVLGVMGLAQLATFYLSVQTNNTGFFAYGVLVLAVILASGAIRRAIKQTERNKSFEALSKELPCAVCRVKVDSRLTIIYANDKYYEQLGYDLNAPASYKLDRAEDVVCPQDIPRFRWKMEDARRRNVTDFELPLRHMNKDGELVKRMAFCRMDSQSGGYLTVSLMKSE